MGYRTIDRDLGGEATAEIVVLRSRFLATVRRVEDEDAARAMIAEIRTRHPDARHHCTAFVLGADGHLRRTNDDGEPSGTAGRPMLDVLAGRGLTDVVAVVTRWFGGTLLGTGGLTRAYGDAVAAALDVAGHRDRELWTLTRVRAAPADAGALENRLRQIGDVLETRWADDVEIRVAVRDTADLDRIEHETIGTLWRDAP